VCDFARVAFARRAVVRADPRAAVVHARALMVAEAIFAIETRVSVCVHVARRRDGALLTLPSCPRIPSELPWIGENEGMHVIFDRRFIISANAGY
jgi:hypothetical protein